VTICPARHGAKQLLARVKPAQERVFGRCDERSLGRIQIGGKVGQWSANLRHRERQDEHRQARRPREHRHRVQQQRRWTNQDLEASDTAPVDSAQQNRQSRKDTEEC